MDALLHHFDSMGWKITFDEYWKSTSAVVAGEEVRFKLGEKVARGDKDFTEEEKPQPDLSDRYVYTPTGLFELTID